MHSERMNEQNESLKRPILIYHDEIEKNFNGLSSRNYFCRKLKFLVELETLNM